MFAKFAKCITWHGASGASGLSKCLMCALFSKHPFWKKILGFTQRKPPTKTHPCGLQPQPETLHHQAFGVAESMQSSILMHIAGHASSHVGPKYNIHFDTVSHFGRESARPTLVILPSALHSRRRPADNARPKAWKPATRSSRRAGKNATLVSRRATRWHEGGTTTSRFDPILVFVFGFLDVGVAVIHVDLGCETRGMPCLVCQTRTQVGCVCWKAMCSQEYPIASSTAVTLSSTIRKCLSCFCESQQSPLCSSVPLLGPVFLKLGPPTWRSVWRRRVFRTKRRVACRRRSSARSGRPDECGCVGRDEGLDAIGLEPYCGWTKSCTT